MRCQKISNITFESILKIFDCSAIYIVFNVKFNTGNALSVPENPRVHIFRSKLGYFHKLLPKAPSRWRCASNLTPEMKSTYPKTPEYQILTRFAQLQAKTD